MTRSADGWKRSPRPPASVARAMPLTWAAAALFIVICSGAGAGRTTPAGTPDVIVGTNFPVATKSSAAPAPSMAEPLPTTETPIPSSMRGWECIPSVIRTNGFEGFRLEVSTGGPVQRVTIHSVSADIVSPQTTPFDLRDDGQGADVSAGDYVYTAGPFRYDPAFPMRANYMDDTDSPSGADFAEFADVTVTETDGTVRRFLVKPAIGLLSTSIPTVRAGTFGGVMRVSRHLVNIWTGDRVTQLTLRNWTGGYPHHVTQYFYQYLPDFADFIAMVSTARLEWINRQEPSNYNSGMHVIVKVDYIRTGWPILDFTGGYYSSGRLQGLTLLDVGPRGLLSSNLAHEITHQWGGRVHYMLDDEYGHYWPDTSIGSLIGGHLWTDHGDGTWTLDCNEGRNGAHHASPLDKYLMGLVEGAAVPPIKYYDINGTRPLARCGVPFSDIENTITMADIQAENGGPREPGPATSQHIFRVAFLAETHRQLFTDTEMTFYDLFAEHFGKQLPAGAPDPYVGCNWVPVTRFFGEGTTWDTTIWLSYDLNHDGLVDGDDVTVFQGCARGADVVIFDPVCQEADFDRDGDADLDDFAGLQRCVTASGAPSDLNCGPP